jgi:hypothetical protein
MKMGSDEKSETEKTNFRLASVILFCCVGFKKDAPAEIFMFYRDTSVIRENLTLPTPPWILNISAPFAISRFSIK